MKPLLATKVKRGEIRNDWESSEHQSTLDGLNAFAERQRKRLAEAQRNASELKAKVRTIAKGQA